MRVEVAPFFALADWTLLVTASVGVLVTALVGALAFFARTLVGRLRPTATGEGTKEEDLCWEDLLELVRRSRSRKKTGQAPDAADEALEELLAGPAPRVGPAPGSSLEDQQYLASGAVERRGGRRRWGNPTEVSVVSSLWPGLLQAVVINRSTGGLALLLDREVPPGTTIKVRSVEAPGSVPSSEATVRHCRKAGKNYLIGCEFSDEIPWNVRVWFG